MQIFRRIDLKTIRPNPDAGRTSIRVAGKTSTIVNPDGSITQTRGYQDVQLLRPQPSHLFEWEPLSLKCERCGEEFPLEELIEEYDEYSIDQRCPKCQAYQPYVEFKFETIEEALKRKENETDPSSDSSGGAPCPDGCVDTSREPAGKG
jgi:DNA-directed RNA polymerase subunit RPC12/RpoP